MRLCGLIRKVGHVNQTIKRGKSPKKYGHARNRHGSQLKKTIGNG